MPTRPAESVHLLLKSYYFSLTFLEESWLDDTRWDDNLRHDKLQHKLVPSASAWPLQPEARPCLSVYGFSLGVFVIFSSVESWWAVWWCALSVNGLRHCQYRLKDTRWLVRSWLLEASSYRFIRWHQLIRPAKITLQSVAWPAQK